MRYLRQEVVAEHEARETSIENLRRELAEEMRREVSFISEPHSDCRDQPMRVSHQNPIFGLAPLMYAYLGRTNAMIVVCSLIFG